MEENIQGIPPIRTMPEAPSSGGRKKRLLIIFGIVVILLGAFFAYWFYFRDTAITEQDKLDILEELKRTSMIDFTPEAKDAILNDLATQSQSQNSALQTMNENEKMDILNSLGGQK